MKILVKKSRVEDALKLIMNIGTKEYTVEEVSSILNVVAYILNDMLSESEPSQVDLHFIVGSLLEILTNNSSYKQQELEALKLILAGVKNENIR
jgi:vacuolar-type H+-ATPase catalytic subunit A/Vma1